MLGICVIRRLLKIKVGKVIVSSHRASNFLSAVTEPNLKLPRTIFSLDPPFFVSLLSLYLGVYK